MIDIGKQGEKEMLKIDKELETLTLHQAIYLAKKEFPKLYKETDGYNYTYANLGTMMETIQPVLDKFFIDIRHEPVGRVAAEKSFVGVKTIFNFIPTGEEDSVEFGHLTDTDDPQSMGSYQTYYRRYNLLCYFNFIPEKKLDDDGERVTKKREVKTTVRKLT